MLAGPAPRFARDRARSGRRRTDRTRGRFTSCRLTRSTKSLRYTMPRKVNRREFVVTSASAGLAAAAHTRTSAQAPAMIRSSVKPVVVVVGQRPSVQERRHEDRRRDRLRHDHRRQGRPRRAHRRRQPVRARSRGHERRLRRAAERRRRRAARCLAACTDRRSAPAPSPASRASARRRSWRRRC